eukprot:TRINITY_DN685_c0_g1_i3.p1 TRINITY_DN685_c0_g1~~TRINITY_DN685_c0_g1_i3.p1  ORF type:complete len:294 (+),score=56.70 TRINITY_DN685_c0_g1_i3:22-882(+)
MATLAAVSPVSQLSSLNRAASQVLGVSNGSRVSARFTKKGTVKKVSKVTSDRPLWFPGAKAPSWLDGSFIGDYGFDPLGLGKPAEYLQFELDELDQNRAKNISGNVIGTRVDKKAEVTPTPFQPYAEVFSITRFRENEVIHGRWAMLGVLGAIAVEAFTGVTWQDAGKVELEQGSSYFGLPLPFSISALVVIEVLLIGYIEFARNAELDTERRIYPGGAYFDPLGLASDPEKAISLKTAELKHARLAMLAALGFAAQAAATGKGPLDNWATHLADPLHTTIFDTFA